MERHIQALLNKISIASTTIATLTLLYLFLQTPQTCIPSNTPPKPHIRFPKSSCDSSHRDFMSLDKKNKRLWSSNAWQSKVSQFTQLFSSLQLLKLLNNDTKVLCVSAGAGHEVMALLQLGVKDVSGVEVVDSLPLVKRADPLNLPFFDGVFDLVFTMHFDEALFPGRFVGEMERTVGIGGVCVLVVEECGGEVVEGILGLFQRPRLLGAANFTFGGVRMTRIVVRVRGAAASG